MVISGGEVLLSVYVQNETHIEPLQRAEIRSASGRPVHEFDPDL